MRWLVMVVALAVAAWGDCSVYWSDLADHLPCGILVEWGPQEPDRDGLCGLAEGNLGAPGSRIIFTRGQPPMCFSSRPVAGCFDPHFDHVYLRSAGRLEDTALVHEWHHRALWLAGEDLDYAHKRPGW